MDKNHKNSIANAENVIVGKTYEEQFRDFGLQELFPGAVYLGKFKNTLIGSTIEHMFEYKGDIYVAECKGGEGLSRVDTVIDILAETVEFRDNKSLNYFNKDAKFIVITTQMPSDGSVVSWNRLERAKEYGLHKIFLWKKEESNSQHENTLENLFDG